MLSNIPVMMSTESITTDWKLRNNRRCRGPSFDGLCASGDAGDIGDDVECLRCAIGTYVLGARSEWGCGVVWC